MSAYRLDVLEPTLRRKSQKEKASAGVLEAFVLLVIRYPTWKVGVYMSYIPSKYGFGSVLSIKMIFE